MVFFLLNDPCNQENFNGVASFEDTFMRILTRECFILLDEHLPQFYQICGVIFVYI